ncbi:BNR repeat-containing protein [Subtercola vilae]|uniref:Uncharacterized protein n=1 Tax=Subtercola vilae TaxID=2056433 RepID=A0A4T2C601_9MICO|nr:BNR repeat-containing protein [Subtercola vilae]TIH39863.1 hypothetical protein D4765_03585 [Subtercola vilae]
MPAITASRRHRSRWQRFALVLGAAGLLGTALVGAALVGGAGSATAAEAEPNTLICTPASGDSSYTLPVAPAQQVVGESQVGTTWSGHFVQQALVTDGDDQYVGFYDANRRLTVAHRTLGSSSTSWQTYALPSDQAVTGWDSHDYIALGVDSVGQLHVAGNMHDSPLAYWATTKARDVSSLTNVPMLTDKAVETRVTYPQFLHGANGDLVFSYRQGGSGDGDSYLDDYDAGTKTWSPLLSTALFSGASGAVSRSAYFTVSSHADAAGYYEMTWVWRSTADVATNSRLSYMRSRDLVHWQTVTGAPVNLPVTYDTPGVVVDDMPENSGVFNNQERVGVDANGSPTVSYSKYDSAGSNQLFVAHLNGSNQWISTQITHWVGAWRVAGVSTLSAQVGVGGTARLPDGNLRLNFSCAGSTPASAVIVLNSTTFEPVAQVPNTPTPIPAQVTAATKTDPSTSVRLVYAPTTGADYVLKWQSQYLNQDMPVLQTPSPQPLVVYTLASPPAATPSPTLPPSPRTPEASAPDAALTLIASIGLLVVLAVGLAVGLWILLRRRRDPPTAGSA